MVTFADGYKLDLTSNHNSDEIFETAARGLTPDQTRKRKVMSPDLSDFALEDDIMQDIRRNNGNRGL